MSRADLRRAAERARRVRVRARGAVALLATVVLGAALLAAAGPASAATPTVGTTSPVVNGSVATTVSLSDTITWTTSGGCSAVPGLAGAPYVHITLDGPGWVAVDLNTTTRTGVSTSAAFSQSQSDTFSGIQASNGLPALSGLYTVTETCQNLTGTTISGQFLAFISFPGGGAAGTVSYPAKTSTSTTLAASPASSAGAGDTVTLTATVSPAAAGSVAFKDGATTVGTASVDTGTGQAVLATTSLAVGSHSLTAVFAPSAPTLYDPSTSSTVTYSIVCASNCPTTVGLGASPASTQRAGQPVTITATVTPTAAGGTVQFTDGGANVGSPVAVSSGQAQLVTSALAVGAHTLGAVYTPGGIYAQSTASTVSYSITVVPTTTTLAASPAGSQVPGGTVTLTATVSPAASGTVQFQDGGVDLGSPVTVTAGQAQLATSALSTGSHSFTAVFTSSDVGYSGSSTAGSTAYSIAVASTATTLAVSPATSAAVGQTITLTATVAPSGATGTVQFQDGGVNIGSPVAVSAGKASTTTSFGVEGAHSFTAAFTSGSAGYADSATASATSYSVVAVVQQTPTLTLVVGPTGTTTTVVNQQVPMTATLSVAEATGSVQFYDGTTALGSPITVVAGAATYATTALAVGSHTLKAVYTSDNGPAFTDATSADVAHDVVDVPDLGIAHVLVANNETSTTGLDESPFLLETESTGVPAGCRAFGSNTIALGAVMTGPGAWVDGVQLITPSTINAAVTLPSGDYKKEASASIKQIAADNGLAIETGRYTITIQCVQYSTVVGTYTGYLWFTDLTHWQTTDPATSATETTVTVSISPAGWSFAGELVTFTATMTPASAAGTVDFTSTLLGATSKIGTTATVNAGTATMTTAGLAIGLYQVGATFTPTDPKQFSASHELQTTPYYVRAIAPVVNVTLPELSASGTVRQGLALLCRPGLWEGNKTGYAVSFVWTRNLAAIRGATTARYVTQAADGGKKVACRVYAKNVGGTVSATSASVTVRLAAASRVVVRPSISGTPRVGRYLVARPGTWTPRPTSYRYQWLRDGHVITGATRGSYRAVRADRGHRISVIVYALRTGATRASAIARAVVVR